MSKFITSYKSTKSINMEYKMLIENTYNKVIEKHFYKTILYIVRNRKTKIKTIMHQSKVMKTEISFLFLNV